MTKILGCRGHIQTGKKAKIAADDDYTWNSSRTKGIPNLLGRRVAKGTGGSGART